MEALKIADGLTFGPTTATKTSEVVADLKRCPTCLAPHAPNFYTSTPRLCDPCSHRVYSAKRWSNADPVDMPRMCEAIGVPARFCRNGVPPSLDDPGIAERLAERTMPAGGLYITGPIGSHKTHLACARAVDAARRGHTVRLINWSMFCLDVRDTYKASATRSEQDILDQYAGLDFLVVDDVGVGRLDRAETDAAVRLAYVLFDQRYNNCKATDVTTNLTPGELSGRFDERIARRLDEMCGVYVMLLAGEHSDESGAVADAV